MGIYEEFKESIKSTVQTAKINTIMRHGRFRADYLFGIESDDDKLYKTVIQEMESVAYREVEYLLYRLCQKYGYPALLESSPHMNCDIQIDRNGEIFKVELKSVPNLHRPVPARHKAEEKYYVYLIKQSVDSYAMMGQLELRYPGMKNYLFADFIELLFGEDEMKEFNGAMLHFSDEMRDAIGFQVTEICNEKNLQELRGILQQELLGFDYDSVRNAINCSVCIRDNTYQKIKQKFSQTYKLMLGSKDFAVSFLTSEWLYRKYRTAASLDHTFIIEGYLKSVEQLLWAIIFVVGKGRPIGKNAHQVDGTDLKPMDIMLGQLRHFLSDPANVDLYNNVFRNSVQYVMDYLEAILRGWTDENRNKYAHKENVNDLAEVEKIRRETYFLYLLILGSLHLSKDNMSDLS